MSKILPVSDCTKLGKALALKMHRLMLKARILEKRLIQIYKVGEGFFWIGGPGEEAFGVPLGLLVNKGRGLGHDWLHLHYRASSSLVAMGLPVIDAVRLMMCRATDPHTGGRNFAGHFCVPKWNVAPITSPIGVQYSVAIGTALAQMRARARGVSIITGGDAGTAEGDFASSLIWASRPKEELPLLITVQNNQWGISTHYSTQHSEVRIADRAKAFGIRCVSFDANCPARAYFVLKEALEYVRQKRKPMLVEAAVSRLYGHSSATGANWEGGPQVDCVKEFEEELFKKNWLKKTEVLVLTKELEQECINAQLQARKEPTPQPSTVWDHTYADATQADWREF